jgi:hypothetical protein
MDALLPVMLAVTTLVAFTCTQSKSDTIHGGKYM